MCGLPLFPAPDEAMAALAGAEKAGKRHPHGSPALDPPPDLKQAAAVLGAANQDGELELPEALELIKSVGIECAPHELIARREEASLAGNILGYPWC